MGHRNTGILHLDLLALLLLDLEQKRAVDAGQDTTKGDGGTNEGVQLLVAADGQLQMTRGNTLDLEILGGVAGKFKDFGGQILEDGSYIDGGCSLVLT